MINETLGYIPRVLRFQSNFMKIKELFVFVILFVGYVGMVYAASPGNIYSDIPVKHDGEIFNSLLHDKNIVVQRIISNGQVTPKNKPYYQKQDEWVIVLQGYAKLKIQNKGIIVLNKGDYYFIPRHTKHWVTYTSKKPKVIWLTVHIFNSPVDRTYNPD